MGIIDNYPDGVCLVELAPVSDARRVVETIATSLQVKKKTNISMKESIKKDIENKIFLLILDNCEHLIDACSAIAEELIQAGEHLTIMTTSREALNIKGEVAWRKDLSCRITFLA